jgi:glutamine cyclotransferase
MITQLLFLPIVLIAFSLGLYAPPAQDTAPPITAERLVVEVISTRPHDPDAYTQGLLLHDGLLYESTGRYGKSTLRQVDPHTGAVLRQVNLPHYLFGEGLALVEDRLIQLTWQEQIALVYDFESFTTDTLAAADIIPYDGQGWGLCYDGDSYLYMSNGSSTLYQRDPDTFAIVDEIEVTLDGAQVVNLNELACVGDSVYANVYLTDTIVRIDKASGQVTAHIDASGLLTPEETAALGQQPFPLSVMIYSGQQQRFVVRRLSEGGFVLNGIAYDPQNDTFLITGKLWPWLFEVRFVPAND